jgi:hypothetical protein
MKGFRFQDFTEIASEFTDEPIEEVKLDLDTIRQNVPSFSSEKLCEMILCDRYFGFECKVSEICMEELGKRRAAGDVFNFESHITSISKELPVLDFKIPDFAGILKKVISGIKQ